MSSMTVRASRKMRSCVANLGPTTASAPSMNAVSVPITTPQPFAASPPGAIARYSRAGTTIPPTAPTTGMTIRPPPVSSPTLSPYRTSMPITKKNRAIRPSLTQWPRSIDSSAPPIAIVPSVAQRDS